MTPPAFILKILTLSALTCVLLQASSPTTHTEEEKLRRKLSELAGNLSDKVLSSDDEPAKKPFSYKSPATTLSGLGVSLDTLKDKELSSSSDEMPNEAQKVRELLRWTDSCSD